MSITVVTLTRGAARGVRRAPPARARVDTAGGGGGYGGGGGARGLSPDRRAAKAALPAHTPRPGQAAPCDRARYARARQTPRPAAAPRHRARGAFRQARAKPQPAGGATACREPVPCCR
eukprot:scaffold19407_cov69-Phaeocystis_antarctica.AAC.3